MLALLLHSHMTLDRLLKSLNLHFLICNRNDNQRTCLLRLWFLKLGLQTSSFNITGELARKINSEALT